MVAKGVNERRLQIVVHDGKHWRWSPKPVTSQLANGVRGHLVVRDGTRLECSVFVQLSDLLRCVEARPKEAVRALPVQGSRRAKRLRREVRHEIEGEH